MSYWIKNYRQYDFTNLRSWSFYPYGLPRWCNHQFNAAPLSLTFHLFKLNATTTTRTKTTLIITRPEMSWVLYQTWTSNDGSKRSITYLYCW